MAFPQFTARHLIIAIACFSLAFGIVAFCYRLPAILQGTDFDDHTYGVLYCALASPVIGTVGGYGVGLIANHRVAGMALGILVAFAVSAIALLPL